MNLIFILFAGLNSFILAFPSTLLNRPNNTETLDDNQLRAGWGKHDITGPIGEIDLMGYAKLGQAANGIHLRLYARAFVIGNRDSHVENDKNLPVVYVSIDAGQVSHFVKDRVIKILNDPRIREENLMISATHTHSGPAGYLDSFLYVANTFGIVQEQRRAQAEGIAIAIQNALQMFESDKSPQSLSLFQGMIQNASRNRSPSSYLANSEQEREWYADQGDTDKTMTILAITNPQTEKVASFINWFAVHGTSMTELYEYVSGDNKGFASYFWERNVTGFVAAFGQSNAGDVTPNTTPPKCTDSGLECDGGPLSCLDKEGKPRISKCIGDGPAGTDGFKNTKIIGLKQAQGADRILNQPDQHLVLPSTGLVEFRHVWIDMSNVTVQLEGNKTGTTCRPAMGQSFAAGTTDGPGVDGNWQGVGKGSESLGFISHILEYILSPGEKLPQASRQLQKCQEPKQVLLATGEYKVPYEWQPTVVPLQLFIIARKLVILGQPSEITTMAGRRLRNAVLKQLVQDNAVDQDAQIVIAGLSNTYSSYLVTFEEYQKQRYEAGSCIFGQHALQAYIDQFTQLAASFTNTSFSSFQHAKSPKREGDYFELALNNNLVHKLITDSGKYGRLIRDVEKEYHVGQVASATFECSHPRSHGHFNSFLAVEKNQDGNWARVFGDGVWDTKFMWKRKGGPLSPKSTCTIEWSLGETIDVEPGEYRLRIFGTAQNLIELKRSYDGVSSPFTVVA